MPSTCARFTKRRDAMIRLTDVAVVRGSHRVVEGLDLTLGPGRVFWVVGPNGAGKSSLLRAIVGLDAPRRGTVVNTGDRLRYFHSEMALPASSTVGGWDRLVRRIGRTGAAGPATPLWPHVEGGRRIRRLSTGQRKRLLLDAVVRQPGPLALDEPFEHLSPGAKSDLQALLQQRAEDEVVIVATNQNTPRDRGDGALYLDAGHARRIDAAEVTS